MGIAKKNFINGKKRGLHMIGNMIMALGSIVFAVLFAFLLFISATVLFAMFKKESYAAYEPDVSIVVPCYNEEKNIAECLDAIYSLDYPKEKIEVIAVDDGSTDNTYKILKKYQKNNKNLVIMEGSHEGKSESLNLGAKKASSEIIFAIDADTVIGKGSLKKLARPFSDRSVGLTNGSCIAKNTDSVMGIFQRIEYHYNNMLRKSFSVLFKNSIWFFGASVCYRKKALEKIGYFKKDTMTEDMDTAMEIYSAGYRVVNVHDALCYTKVPSTVKQFSEQRTRWFIGALQSLRKNKALFNAKSSPSILFAFISQYWWALYAVISFPLIAYQVYYWLPYNNGSFEALFMYLFRWFSLLGPVYVVYKIPEWGISLYNIFGVLSGVMSLFLMTAAIYLFNDRLNFKNLVALFFYFPYTILLNTITILGLIKLIFIKKRHFIY